VRVAMVPGTPKDTNMASPDTTRERKAILYICVALA
jgi:hypothetical protein